MVGGTSRVELTTLGCGQVATVIGAIVATRFLTELLTPDAYGDLALALTVVALLSLVGSGPVGNAVGRFYAVAHERQTLRSLFHATAVLYGQYHLGACSFAFVALLIYHDKTLIAIGLPTIVLSAVNGANVTLDSMQNAARQRVVVAWHQAAGQWFRLGSAVICIRLVSATAASALCGYVVASVLVLGSQFLFFKLKLSALAAGEPCLRELPKLTGEMAQVCSPVHCVRSDCVVAAGVRSLVPRALWVSQGRRSISGSESSGLFASGAVFWPHQLGGCSDSLFCGRRRCRCWPGVSCAKEDTAAKLVDVVEHSRIFGITVVCCRTALSVGRRPRILGRCSLLTTHRSRRRTFRHGANVDNRRINQHEQQSIGGSEGLLCFIGATAQLLRSLRSRADRCGLGRGPCIQRICALDDAAGSPRCGSENTPIGTRDHMTRNNFEDGPAGAASWRRPIRDGTETAMPPLGRSSAPRISVLMSTYAGEKEANLRSAVTSILEQTSLPDELVLVIDGPVGIELEAVIADLEKRSASPVVRIVRLHKNLGLARALNQGLSVCAGEYVARMDSDDISYRDRLERQTSVLIADPSLDLVASWHAEFRSEEPTCTRLRLRLHRLIIARSPRP